MSRRVGEKAEMKSDEQIVAEIRKAVEGLYVMSESDYPFETIRWGATVALSPQYFRELHGEPPDSPVTSESLSDFPGFVMSQLSGEGNVAPAGAARYRQLVRVLQENLTDVKVYRVGRVNIPVYVVGRSPGGNWLGLSTRVVET